MASGGGRTPSPRLLSLLPFVLLAFIPARIPDFSTRSSIPRSAPSSRNFVVRFREYRGAADHLAYLESALPSPEGWRWIERRNPAAVFPTDFGVLEIADSRREDLIGELERLGRVKDVWPDSSISRGVLADEEKNSGGGGFCDVRKRPGKLFTPMSFDDDGGGGAVGNVSYSCNWKRKLLMQRSQITSLFGADILWSKGFRGAKVKMAVFDTGIRADHPHFRNIKERTNWTTEDTLNDSIGHGTFVAGVIAGEGTECLGFAPETEIYAFRVFTDAQVSYTSWFLDAFNYAIATYMDVLNLSIGGPDYLDLPFVEKVWELTANNIIMVSAIGNDGPLYGTLNNPADQSDVIGVGGIDYSNHIASFSSRGMTTWEIPHGYGRVKPDVVAYSRGISGPKISSGCKTLSGTSVASPVVAGAVCLLLSSIPVENRKNILNPASMKQALVEGAVKLSGPNIYEQGAGRLNLLNSYEILKNYQPRASIFPSALDYSDCPYAWPFCRQPLYAGAMPVVFNVTILNGMGVIGYVESSPIWQPFDEVGNLLSIHFSYSDVIWPWTGHLALRMEIKEEGSQFSGVIEGNVTVKVYSPAQGEISPQTSTCVLYLKLDVVPTPPRWQRVLWDQFHNIKYPPGYIPRDSLEVRNDVLDWHGDHLHTNFHIMYNMLRDAGYFVETLGSPLTCFDASRYGTLLMVDLEDEFFPEEIEKLKDDIANGGLGLAVFSEWYNVDSMIKMRFFDDNTRSWWTPATGGANIPALNELLAPLGISFGDRILTGYFSINGEQCHYASGTDIIKFPRNGYLHSFPLQDNSETGAEQNSLQAPGTVKEYSILGLVEVGRGRATVYGDSNCLDSSHMVTNCYWLLKKILDFTSRNVKDPMLFNPSKLTRPTLMDNPQLPSRRTDVNFSTYSAVVGKELVCHQDSRFEVWGTKGYGIQLMGRNRRLPGYPAIVLDSGMKGMKGMNQNGGVTNYTGIIADAIGRKNLNKSNDVLGLLNSNEVDLPMIVASHWVVPAFVLLTCLMLLLSWRMRQRRRRQRRGPTSGRGSNLL